MRFESPRVGNESSIEQSRISRESGAVPDQGEGETPPLAPGPRCWSLERLLLRRMLRMVGDPALHVTLWDGSRFGPEQGAQGRVHIRSRNVLWRLLGAPAFEFFELYSRGELELEGDLTRILCAINGALKQQWQHRRSGILRQPGARSVRASLKNVQHHYDLGNDFYRLWLDEQLVYTCAYYETDETTLAQAQVAKMDHVCRKLRLRPGDEVIEAGCGWGALALHMAREYGATVKAYNVSKEQLEYARQRAGEEGLADQVEFIGEDWRNIRGECDVFVSVGMLEHVGPANFRRLGEVIHRVLRDQGRGLIHTIGRNWDCPLNPWIERRIFPGAQPPTLKQMMEIFEPPDFSVIDVENLRVHYARTCRDWLQRVEDSAEKILEMFDQEFLRMWRMYLAASTSAFETGWLQLFQVLFQPGENNHIPATRSYMYAPQTCSVDVSGNGAPRISGDRKA
jgi:cyclopropane-fatty-acyl-phospholipid synthase